KGLLGGAKKLARKNVATYYGAVNDETPLVGIEPSAVLTFRDEYPKLLRNQEQKEALEVAKHVYTITEFLYREAVAGRIGSHQFSGLETVISLHTHCYEKALGNPEEIAFLLSLPRNYIVHSIPSGCCGMAGSFGYERAHYALSMQIGEEVLFPTIRSQPHNIIAATGTSCRHQILDGTGREAKHPVEVLLAALLPE
ncbi:MAG: FAD-binding oxidoreductase, partial [Bacteroidota bacterium]